MLLDGSSARNSFNPITISMVVTSSFEIAKAHCVAVAGVHVARRPALGQNCSYWPRRRVWVMTLPSHSALVSLRNCGKTASLFAGRTTAKSITDRRIRA